MSIPDLAAAISDFLLPSIVGSIGYSIVTLGSSKTLDKPLIFSRYL